VDDWKGTREVHEKMEAGKSILLQSVRLVGAVGIENNANWNFKDLREMPRSVKTLKRNNEELCGVLIGPSMAPRFPGPRIPFVPLDALPPAVRSASGPNSCGTDGKPTAHRAQNRISLCAENGEQVTGN